MDVVDSHQHYWMPERGDYWWMIPGSARDRDFLPQDLLPHLESVGVSGTIVVQAARTTAETDFLMSLVTPPNKILGVVGWVDLVDSRSAAGLARFAADTRVVGVRAWLEGESQPEWFTSPECLKNLQRCAQAGLAVDVLCRPEHLGLIAEVALRVANLELIIDHLAKPDYRNGNRQWFDDLTRFESLINVSCKLSGMVSEIGPDWCDDDFRPHVEHVLEVFGPARTMFGSDWPVMTVEATYLDVVESLWRLTSHLSPEERALISAGTARRVYGLARRA